MTQHRVLIDIQFTVDDDRFKVVHLTDDANGVSDVTDTRVCAAVTGCLVEVDWAEQGMAPVRSVVTTRSLMRGGVYREVLLPAETTVVDPPDRHGEQFE